EKTGATVYLPSYPLSPNNTYRKAYSLLSAYWKELCSHYKKIFLVGDSAGGGIALSLTGIFRDSGERLADKIVVISPLTDSSLTASDYTEYEKKDPLLGVTGIREFAKLWSDTTDPEDPSISPLFGSSRGFPQTLVLAGTHECLYPDIIKYYEKINKEGVDATLVTGKKMNHVWPLYPIREAERALGCIAGFLLNN
nr:alpha/beta hydrolase [Sphaerochaetaceae bacterium]